MSDALHALIAEQANLLAEVSLVAPARATAECAERYIEAHSPGWKNEQPARWAQQTVSKGGDVI